MIYRKNLGLNTIKYIGRLPKANIALFLIISTLMPSISAELVIDQENPRYFKDTLTGETVYMTGSHTWWNLQAIGRNHPPPRFNYDAHINWYSSMGFNHLRLWHFESAYWYIGGKTKFYVSDHPYQRTGPGNADDGRPKFDLAKLNQAYFDKMRDRVIKAGNKGIYVSVMLFQGIAASDRKAEWAGHPFNSRNNINGINADLNNNGAGSEFHSLRNKAVLDAQRRYVRKVIDTLNDLDNVLWEIGNEIHPGQDQIEWSYDTIRYIKNYEKTKPKQHLVGLSYMYGNKDGGRPTKSPPSVYDNSPADWISIASHSDAGWDDYKYDPPAATGRKLIFSDSDHLWGSMEDSETKGTEWIWKSALMSLHPIFMDFVPLDYESSAFKVQGFKKNLVSVRNAMKYTKIYMDKLDLSKVRPGSNLCSLKHCLAQKGQQYLAYKAANNRNAFTIRGLRPNNEYEYEWFDTVNNRVRGSGTIVPKSSSQSFAPPTTYALLYLKNIESGGSNSSSG